MTDTPFVHLHCHTDYSLLDGACEINKLMKLVKAQGMPSVAMTDHGNLFGAAEFYFAAKAAEVHPVIGCELYITQQDRHIRNESNRYNHLVLLCENQEGYKNLIKLVSTGYLDGFYYKPRVDKDLLAQHSKGLIAMSACLRGDVNEAIMKDRYSDAVRLSHEYQEIFGKNNFFLEIQDHGLDEDKKLMPEVYRLSRETGIPMVASNDAHYLEHSDHRAQDILVCISTGKSVNDTNRMKFSTEQFYLKSKAEMMKVFGDVEHALDRTWDIAQRCQMKLEKVKDPFPKFDVPAEHTIDTYFEYVARQGFEKRRVRLDRMAEAGQLRFHMADYVERLDREIKLIQQMKFSGYFLIVWDFIRYAKQNGIPVGPGRGSAAGSLVGYCMGITDVDPLHYGLLFERFLNPERVSMPDVDVDFCTNKRGQVIQYVTEKYGREQVAQIITFGSLAAKAVIKDVGRVLDMSFGEVDKISKMVPAEPGMTLKKAMEVEPAILETAERDPRVKDMLDVAQRLEGLARNSGVHAAGVVISPVPLADIVPLYKTNKDEIVTQFDMKRLEKLGLLKMDFLGLTTLTIIHEALDLIKKTRGETVVLEELPLDDKVTYEKIFTAGLTDGVFQFESSGMKDVLRRSHPERIEDLIALNALYRPGPIQNGFVDDYIDRKLGNKAVTYDLPELKALLEETYGLVLYQEQVMQVAQRIAGYSLGEADLLRRAMGKKDKAEMERQSARFLQGAAARGVAPKKAQALFDLLAKFAEYGFNKSHSAAYGYLAYLTGYLKAHYTVEFLAALLTSETGNTDKVVKYINECRALGITVLPPDVNESDLNFTPVGLDKIRFGMGAVKNVGVGAVEAIVKARGEHGRFTDLDDFCENVDLSAVNRRVVESLIRAGAMDGFTGTRAQKFAVVEDCMESGQRAQKDAASGQTGLFGELLGGDEGSKHERELPRVNDWTPIEKLKGEKETIGFYVSGHPLDEYGWKVPELTPFRCNSLEGVEKGQEIALCGIITGIQRRRNKEQKPWAFMALEDWNGSIEAMVFASKYEALQREIEDDKAVMMRGKAMVEEDGTIKLNVAEIVPMAVARVNFPTVVSVRVRLNAQGAERAEKLKDLFRRKPGETSVRLKLERAKDFQLLLDVPVKIRPDKEFKAELEQICGAEAMEVIAS